MATLCPSRNCHWVIPIWSHLYCRWGNWGQTCSAWGLRVTVAFRMPTPAPCTASAAKFSVKSAEMQDDGMPWRDCKGFWTGITSYCIKGPTLDIYRLFDECWGNFPVNSLSLGAWQCSFWPLSCSISHWVATKSRDFMYNPSISVAAKPSNHSTFK